MIGCSATSLWSTEAWDGDIWASVIFLIIIFPCGLVCFVHTRIDSCQSVNMLNVLCHGVHLNVYVFWFMRPYLCPNTPSRDRWDTECLGSADRTSTDGLVWRLRQDKTMTKTLTLNTLKTWIRRPFLHGGVAATSPPVRVRVISTANKEIYHKYCTYYC